MQATLTAKLPKPSDKELRDAHRFLALHESFEDSMAKPAIAQCIRATARARIKKRERILQMTDFKKLALPDD